MTVLDDGYLENLARGRAANGCLGGLILFGVFAALLYWFHDTTELAPAHDNVALGCTIVACVLALASVIIGFRKHPDRGVIGRLFLGIGYGLFGYLVAIFAATECATIVEGWIDFPTGATRSSQRLIAIADGSHSVGSKGGQTWRITTLPYDATLDITREDYGFMLAHRLPDDDASEPDKIASNGHFCARVTIEQAGDALRIMHAGSATLPEGSVILCPEKSVSR